MKYTASAFGWMVVVDAPNARKALSMAKSAAAGASLMTTDVTSVRPATSEEIEWHGSMGGAS